MIPDWFEPLHRDARNEYADARAERDAEQQRDVERQQRIDRLTEELDVLEARCAPHDHAIARTTGTLRDAQQRHRRAERELADTGLLRRRAARQDVATAADDVHIAHAAVDQLTRRAQPLYDLRGQIHHERDRLRRELRRDRQFSRSLDRYDDRLERAQQTLAALDAWRQWAAGRALAPDDLINAASQLHHVSGQHALLAQPLTTWIEQHEIVGPHPTPSQRSLPEVRQRPDPPGVEIDL